MGKRTDARDFWSLCFDLHTAHHVDVTKLEVVTPNPLLGSSRNAPLHEKSVA